MLSKQKIKNWLLNNAVNEYGDLDLSDLDFSNFNGDVYISEMKVKESLFQSNQEVGENLYQDSQTVGGIFYNHKLKENEYWEEYEEYVVRGKKLKEITLEELEKMGYKLKESIN